jgi:hypothetical protein
VTYRSISWTQVSQKCLRALGYYREGAPLGPPSIALLQGRAVHAGIEHHLEHGDPVAAVEAAHVALDFGIEEAGGLDGVAWEEPPRLTKSSSDWPLGRPYSGDEGNMPDLLVARTLTRLQVEAWIARFPALRVTQRPNGSIGLERKERFDLEDGWSMPVVYDVEPDEGGLIDIKVSRQPWDIAGKELDRVEQLRLYTHAKLILDGELPEFVVYHVLPRSSVEVGIEEPGERGGRPAVVMTGYDAGAIQIIEIDYDPAAVVRVLKHRVAPTIAAIEANAWVPNTSGWWCSRKFCDYWDLCPFGAAARERPEAAP